MGGEAGYGKALEIERSTRSAAAWSIRRFAVQYRY
jgi:hypothetical protein